MTVRRSIYHSIQRQRRRTASVEGSDIMSFELSKGFNPAGGIVIDKSDGGATP